MVPSAEGTRIGPHHYPSRQRRHAWIISLRPEGTQVFVVQLAGGCARGHAAADAGAVSSSRAPGPKPSSEWADMSRTAAADRSALMVLTAVHWICQPVTLRRYSPSVTPRHVRLLSVNTRRQAPPSATSAVGKPRESLGVPGPTRPA